MSLSPFVSSISVGGKKIQIETGALARQAHGAVLVTCGEDQVLVTVVSDRKESDVDFFPLTVEYQERFYSAGKIPGGFFRREGRPSYESTLLARMVDRPIRPCFPDGYCYETQIVATVLSYSGEFPIGILASLGASAAVHISDIPFNGPVASVQVAKIGEKLVLNPSVSELTKATINMIVAGSRESLLMVEGEAKFISESEALEALKFAHQGIQLLLDVQNDLQKKVGSTPKRQWSPFTLQKEWSQSLETKYRDSVKKCLEIKEKTERRLALDQLKTEMTGDFIKEEDAADVVKLKTKNLESVLDQLKYTIARQSILQTARRIDGRSCDTIRPISTYVGFLPRVHGSAVFTRGETQVLAIVTLGTGDDEQKLDTLSGCFKKQFLLHYNFPHYSVGETGRMGGQSRREIGHGSLAEKALKAALPSHEKFPYTIRVVSEVLESNGSSSMGTVCSGSLALMDAGVPMQTPIAGIAMGLIQEKDQFSILSDILGDEDHLGDMDFKVAGSKDGITALQMDVKTNNLSFSVMKQALEQARTGRLHILAEMEKTLSQSRENVSVYAPRIKLIHIKPEKIREVIGSGGKVINKIIEETGVKVDIQDSGKIFISSTDLDQIQKAQEMIENICLEVEVDGVYKGTVTKLAPFGAFVEILPGTTGLLHISEIAPHRIQRVEDVLKEGDSVEVKVLEVGNRGKIRLSRKALLRSQSK